MTSISWTSSFSSAVAGPNSSAFGIGFLKAAHIIPTPRTDINAQMRNVSRNPPVNGMSHPKNATSGIDISMMSVGCSEYIEFRMRLGITSNITR